MPEDHHTGDGPPDPVLAVIADPEQGRHRLPYLLGVLDDGDAADRLTTATAVCLVVEAYPDMLTYVVERLVDRLDDDAPVAVGHALDYLAARDPRGVDEAVTAMDEADELRARDRLFQSGGGFARSGSLLPGTSDRTVGRTRVAGAGDVEDPRQVRTTDPGPEVDPLIDDRDGAEDDGADEAATGDGESQADGSTAGFTDEQEVTRGTLSLVADRLAAVIDRSQFETLDVLTDRRRARFGDVYRAAGTLDGREVGVALTVFELPDTDRVAFAGNLRAALTRWAGVDDHDRVLTVHDWGIRPRPWAALAFTDETLADHDPGRGTAAADPAAGNSDSAAGNSDPAAGNSDGVAADGDDPPDAPSLDAAVSTALDLAEGVAHVHQHGVVHGALDPEAVAFPGTALTDSERQRPFLAHPGMTMAYAGHGDVAAYIDPRYAAPEYFDDEFGGIDHATDVYGLGLLCYRLVTGEHPYPGPLADLREAVLNGQPPRPSAVNPSLPPALDRVVEKATATRKLKRYETINVFRRELRSIDTNGG